MQHYHLFGCINDVCYRLPLMERKDKVLWSEEMPSDTRASMIPGAKIFTLHVNINSSDFVKPITNQDYCEEILNWAKELKVEQIIDLRDTFKIELDYMIYTNGNELLYEGSSCWTTKAKEILIPSQVDEESNQLNYRKGIRIEKNINGIEKALPASYGFMKGSCREEFYFLIKGIRIKGISDEGFVDKKPEFFAPIVDLSGRRHYTHTVAKENSILLFDSTEYGIDFPPERIQFRPKQLTVELNVVLNNFCEFGNEATLLEIIHENNGSASSETGNPMFPCHPNIHPHHGVYIPHPTKPIRPVRPPFPLVPPVPEKPEEPDDGTGDENPDPENPGTGEDETPVIPPTDLEGGGDGSDDNATDPTNPDEGGSETNPPEGDGNETGTTPPDTGEEGTTDPITPPSEDDTEKKEDTEDSSVTE